MGKNYVIDTADVILRRKSDNMTIFTASATTAGLNIDADGDTQRGGIGNKPLFRYNHSKETNLNIVDALFNSQYLALSQGVAVEEGKSVVTITEKALKVEENEDALEVTIKGEAEDGKAILVNNDDESKEADVSSGKVSVPEGFAEKGESVTVLYKEEVEGKVIKIDATKFGESYECQYHTIAYDTETNEVTKDIYMIFENVVPEAAFEMSLEAGEPIAPEITLEALTSGGSDDIGRYVEVPRKGKEVTP